MLYSSQMAHRSNNGFTIIEVMLVIVVSGALLVSALSTIQQNKRHVEFSQSVRDLESQLNDVINDIPTGYFLSNTNLRCRVTGNNRPQISNASGSSLGSNNDCIYVGKVLQFLPNGNNARLYIYNLAGRRRTPSGNTATTLTDAKPVAVYTPTLDTIKSYRLQNGLTIKKVFNADDGTTYGSLGIISNISGTTNTTGESNKVGGLAMTPFSGANKSTTVARVNTLSDTNFDIATKGIVICLINGYNEKGSITVGANGSPSLKLATTDYDLGCDT